MMIKNHYLDSVLSWANTQDDIRAVVVTGSLSRNDGSTDEWSDLDVELICTHLSDERLASDWLDDIGEVWIRFPADTLSPFRLVWFAGGNKVDFQLQTVAQKQAMISSQELSDEYKRGYIVALDKDNLFAEIPSTPRIFPQSDPPNPEQVHQVLNEFWFEAIHVAQFIRRREFWVVKFRDWTMKCDLLQLIEWHTQLTRDDAPNTWIIGKRIHQWADEHTYQEVQKIWSGWSAEACWTSLLVMLKLFTQLSKELTAQLNYPYPEETYHAITTYIHQLRNDDTVG